MIGDEVHALYDCNLLRRDDLGDLDEIDQVWYQPEVFRLFSRMKAAKLL